MDKDLRDLKRLILGDGPTPERTSFANDTQAIDEFVNGIKMPTTPPVYKHPIVPPVGKAPLLTKHR